MRLQPSVNCMQNVAALIPKSNGFSIEGEVSFFSVLSLRQAGEKWITQFGQSECVVDLGGMHNKDASIFSLLLCWMRCAKKRGVVIRFVSVSQSLLRMQQLFGLNSVWINL